MSKPPTAKHLRFQRGDRSRWKRIYIDLLPVWAEYPSLCGEMIGPRPTFMQRRTDA